MKQGKQQQQSYRLSKNDIIKMGRVKLKVSNIKVVKEDKQKEAKQKRREKRVKEAIKN
jgi:hypothetical protein